VVARRIYPTKEALKFGGDICTSEMDLLTIARLLYIREMEHCERQLEPCHKCSRSRQLNFNTVESNRKIDKVFADEIAGMQDD